MYFFGGNASNQYRRGAYVHTNDSFNKHHVLQPQIVSIPAGREQMNGLREELAEVEGENARLREQLRLREEKEQIRRLREEIRAVATKNESLKAEIAAKGIEDMRGTVEDCSSSSSSALSSSSAESSASEDESELEYEELTFVSPKRKRKRKLAPLRRRKRAPKRKRDEESASDVYEPPRKKLKFGNVSKFRFGKGSLAVLIDYWDSHVDSPFPKGQDRTDLARRAHVTPLQVKHCLKTLFFLLVYRLDRV